MTLALLLATLTATAQDNGLNPIFEVEVQELTYEIPQKKTTVGSVIGTLVSAAAGVSTDTYHEEKIPALNSTVRSAISGVRRLSSVTSLMDEGFIVSGSITTISTTTQSEVHETKDKDGKVRKETWTRYDAKVAVALTLTDKVTGEQSTERFSKTGYSDGLTSTADKALEVAISNLGSQITAYYNDVFPLSANVVERGTEKKDKTKELYIDVGSAIGVYEGQHFTLYLLGEVAGRETRQEMGRLKVTEVLGDDICLCKVQKGGKDVKKAIDEGKTILAVSRD